MKFKPGITYGWLHKRNEESICLDLNSEEYKSLQDEGWTKTIPVKQEDDYESLEIEELRSLAKSKGMIGYGNAKRETLIKKLRS